MVNLINQIVIDLHKLGVEHGDVIMVHSSFKSLGDDELTPESVIRALIESVGENGTLLMPALSYEEKNDNLFSVLETPTNVGILSEIFRKRQGTLRSIHPTHSVCGVGVKAKELLSDHHLDTTPCGNNSPFNKIIDMEAKIIMLGCGFKPNTTMHALEEIANVPYLFGGYSDYNILEEDGRRYTKKYIKHGFIGWSQEYDKITLLNSKGLYRSGKVIDADTHIIDTMKLKGSVLSKLREDPLFFVSRTEDENRSR